VAPSRARALCAKVIAHCIMPMAGLPQGMVVKPRIAMALVPSHGSSAQAVTVALDEMLNSAGRDSSRIILLAEAAPAPDDPAALPVAPTLPSTQATNTDFQATSAKEEADY
jgi:hypothetical protein